MFMQPLHWGSGTRNMLSGHILLWPPLIIFFGVFLYGAEKFPKQVGLIAHGQTNFSLQLQVAPRVAFLGLLNTVLGLAGSLQCPSCFLVVLFFDGDMHSCHESFLAQQTNQLQRQHLESPSADRNSNKECCTKVADETPLLLLINSTAENQCGAKQEIICRFKNAMLGI